jgi:hypothetical protein
MPTGTDSSLPVVFASSPSLSDEQFQSKTTPAVSFSIFKAIQKYYLEIRSFRWR